MPLPKTRDIGKIIRFLKKERRKRPLKQIIAIALSHARKMGAKIKSPRHKALENIRKS